MGSTNGHHTNGKHASQRGNGGAPEPDRDPRQKPDMGQATTGKVAEKAGEVGMELPMLTKKDFTSDQETRWCPGCGDYAILASVQNFMPSLGVPPHKMVFISGTSTRL